MNVPSCDRLFCDHCFDITMEWECPNCGWKVRTSDGLQICQRCETIVTVEDTVLVEQYVKYLQDFVCVEDVPLEEGGGYRAYIPDFMEHSFVGAGDTPQEAKDNLDLVSRSLLPILIREGVPMLPLHHKDSTTQ